MLTLLIVTSFGIAGQGVLHAQIITASITGTVVDAQKAVIPSADIVVKGTDNGLVRKVKSNQDGFFSVSQLQPGTYSITVQAKTFETLSEQNIVITAAKDVSLGSLTLLVGSISEVVDVKTDQSGIDRENPNTEAGLSTEELEKIQVRSYDIMEALTLLPGTVDNSAGTHDAPNSSSGGNTYINGMRNSSTNIMIDGVSSADPGSGSVTNTLPSVEMVAELKLMSSNFRADSGRNSGSSVIIVTKSGTTKLHGSFDFPFRNEFFDANDPDQKRQQLPKTQYRLILPSYTLTGPLVIPHLIPRRANLSFTLSQQFQWQSQDPLPSIKRTLVPTIAERQGDFSASRIYSFNTTTLAANTPSAVALNTAAPRVIDSTHVSIDPIGASVLNLFPLPQGPTLYTNGTFYNYVSTTSSHITRSSSLYRVDWAATPRTQMYLRVLITPETDQAAWNPQTNSTNGGFSNVSYNIGQFQEHNFGTGFLLNVAHTFSSTLVNTIGISTSTTKTTGSAQNPSAITAAGTGIVLPQLFASANPAGYLPNISFGCQNQPDSSACPATAYNQEAIPAFQLDASFPNHQHLHSIQFTDNLTKVYGTHSFVGGVYYEIVHRNYAANGAFTTGTNDRGSYSFMPDKANPCDTTNPFANILTGCIDSYNQNNTRPTAFLRFKNLEFYAQDEWRATSRMTLSYGLRVYHDLPAHDALNQYQVFVPARYNLALAPRLYRPSGSGACNSSFTSGTCAIDSATGTQVLYGQSDFYVPGSSPLTDPTTNGIVEAGTNGIPRSIFTIPIFSLAPRFGFNYAITPRMVVKGGFGIYYDRFPLQNQLNMLSNPPINRQIAVNDVGATLNPGGGYTSGFSTLSTLSGFTPPQITTLPTGSFIPPTTKSYSLEVQQQLGKTGLVGLAYVGNASQHLAALQQINGGLSYNQLYYLHPEDADSSKSRTACGGTFCMLPNVFTNQFPGFGSIRSQTLRSRANYNSLQLSVEKRFFDRHLQLRGNWTHGKTLADAGTDTTNLLSDPNLPIHNYSRTLYDRANVINAFYILDFPDPGRAMRSRFLSGIAGNWSVSGTWKFSSGAPFTPSLYISGAPGAGGNGLIGNTSQNISGSTDLSRVVLLSPSAKLTVGDAAGKFAGPLLGTWGNTSSNQFNLPSWQEFDATFYRTFKPTEKLSVIFRTEIYNIPNSAIVTNLNTVLQYNYNNTNAPQGSNINTYFWTPNGGAGLNGQLTHFFRRGRIIQFDLSGRW